MRGQTDNQAPRTASISIEPLTVRIPVAVQLTGLSRSRIYELIESGDLDIVKVGRSTLIPYKSLKRLIGEQV
jgi:excisionase family DNA binding protein